LGIGAFGIVRQIISKETFALKQIDFNKLMDDLDDEEELHEQLSCAFSEFQIMKKNLPNVVRSYQYHFDKEENIFSFTMDLMKGKDLGTLIQKKSIPFEQFYKLFQDIVTGMNYAFII
jgi:serine/threonine protein kinase